MLKRRRLLWLERPDDGSGILIERHAPWSIDAGHRETRGEASRTRSANGSPSATYEREHRTLVVNRNAVVGGTATESGDGCGVNR